MADGAWIVDSLTPLTDKLQGPLSLSRLITMWTRHLALYVCLAALVAHNGHAASAATGGLRIVENSGECETVPGVYQASGYADIDANNSML